MCVLNEYKNTQIILSLEIGKRRTETEKALPLINGAGKQQLGVINGLLYIIAHLNLVHFASCKL